MLWVVSYDRECVEDGRELPYLCSSVALHALCATEVDLHALCATETAFLPTVTLREGALKRLALGPRSHHPILVDTQPTLRYAYPFDCNSATAATPDGTKLRLELDRALAGSTFRRLNVNWQR